MLSPEAVLVDRLAAWQFWNSTTDAASASFVYQAVGDALDEDALEVLVRKRSIGAAWESLRIFAGLFSQSEPMLEDLTQWAESAEF